MLVFKNIVRMEAAFFFKVVIVSDAVTQLAYLYKIGKECQSRGERKSHYKKGQESELQYEYVYIMEAKCSSFSVMIVCSGHGIYIARPYECDSCVHWPCHDTHTYIALKIFMHITCTLISL